MKYIEIREEKLPITFNILAMRTFCKEKGLAKLSEFDTIFKEMDFNDLTIEQMDDFALLVMCAIKEGCRQELKKCELTIEDVLEILFTNPNSITEVFEEFSQSISSTDELKGEGESSPQVRKG